MKWALLLAIPILVVALSLSGPHVSHLTLGHFLLHIATAVLVVLPVYLAVNAYARTGSRRFLLLTAAFVALAAREITLSYFMITVNSVQSMRKIGLGHCDIPRVPHIYPVAPKILRKLV